MEAYCVRCKAKREIKDTQPVKFKNGRDGVKGVCTTCGTTVVRMGKGT